MNATTKETSRAAFRKLLNERHPEPTHRHHAYHQKSRPYGDYLWHQDRAKFEVEYAEWLAAKEAA